MADNEVYRVYNDEETMLKVYDRRLRMADRKFNKVKDEYDHFWARYKNQPTLQEITEDGHRVVVAEGLSVIDTMYSSMTAVDVEFLCKAIGVGTELQAIAATAALNQFLRDTKGARRAKKAIKDALIVDMGVVKVYYDYREDVMTVDRPDAAVKSEIEELMGRGMELDEALKQVPMTEKSPVIVRDRVCLEHVPYDMVRYDPTCDDIDDVRWWAQYTKLPVGEVVQNPTYRSFVEDRYGKAEGDRLLDGLEGDSTIRINGLDIDSIFDEIGDMGKEDDNRVTVVEMWDLETGLISVFPKNRHDLVLHQRLNPLMMNVDMADRSPFKPLILRKTDDARGMGDMRAIMPSLAELDEYRSNLATHVTRTIPKLIGPDRALTDQGKKALESQTWGEYVGLAEGHVGQEVQPLVPPPLPQEALQVTERIQSEIRDATGASEVLQGIFPQGRKTATEVQTVSSSGERRQAERRSAVIDWWEDIGRTALQLMQVYYDQKRILRYTDDLGQDFVWQWNQADIVLEADIRVDLTPKEDLSRSERGQRAYQVLNLALAVPETDRSAVLTWFYRELGLTESEIRQLVKTPQEVQMEQAQQQLLNTAVPPGGSPPGLQIQQPFRGGNGTGKPAVR